jgi:L-aminopeptidase/D-esterase-like protein
VYFYFQPSTVDPDTPGDEVGLGKEVSVQIEHYEEELEQQPLQPLTGDVSNTGCSLILCHKHLSFKLHVKGGGNSLVGSAVL